MRASYRLIKSHPIVEKRITCHLLKHIETGAHHLHVEAPHDDNNVFCVAFMTTPQDDTGAAHILEHTALCGSERFPVRDPFFNMVKRSLNTFMNAMTGSDYTMYPFSTRNPTDWRNLMSVYLDAAFFPRLQRLDFLQEGHRLEMDEQQQLTRTGVVFNEMHGALSDANSLFREQMGAALYPTTTYGRNSGGDPLHIPELTWEGLRAFHARYYHPSNAWFYTYGSFPLAEHLEMIDEQVLSKFGGGGGGGGVSSAGDPPISVPMEIPWMEPRHLRCTGPPQAGQQDLQQQHKGSIVWLLHTPITDIKETVALGVLSDLLIDGPSAPIYRALLETRLASGYAPMTGFESYNKQPTFGFGGVGMTEEDAIRLPLIIKEALEQAAHQGFPADRVEALLHQLELSNKHVTTSYGLNAGLSAVHMWMHGGDPAQGLEFDRWMEGLRADMAKGDYWGSLIRRHLLENQHHVVAHQSPDVQYSSKLAAEERARLDALQGTLSAPQLECIRQDSLALKAQQEQAPNVECLPTLKVQEIPERHLHANVVQERGLRFAPQPNANGVVYLNWVMDVGGLPETLMRALPLWSSLVTSQGARGYGDHREVAQAVEMFTGGISLSPSITTHGQDVKQFQVLLTGHSHCLQRNTDRMLDLVRALLTSPDWSDRDNVAALVEQSATSMLESLTRSGHSYAAQTAASVFGRPHALSELWHGVSQASYLSQLATDVEGSLDALLEEFYAIEAFLRSRVDLVRVQVNAQGLDPVLEDSIRRLWPATALHHRYTQDNDGGNNKNSTPQRIFVPVASQVNHVARVVPTGLAYCHADLAPLAIGARVVNSCFLHRELREKGGAYGGGCSASSDGTLRFTSYRDPHVLRTVDTFEESVRWVTSSSSSSFTDRDVDEAKLSTFSMLDKPVPPSSKGLGGLYNGISNQDKDEYRHRLLAVTRDSIVDVFQRIVVPAMADSISIAAIGSDQFTTPEGWISRKI